MQILVCICQGCHSIFKTADQESTNKTLICPNTSKKLPWLPLQTLLRKLEDFHQDYIKHYNLEKLKSFPKSPRIEHVNIGSQQKLKCRKLVYSG